MKILRISPRKAKRRENVSIIEYSVTQPGGFGFRVQHGNDNHALTCSLLNQRLSRIGFYPPAIMAGRSSSTTQVYISSLDF